MHSRNGKWAAVLTAVLLAEVMLIHLLPSLLNVKLPEYTKLISELLPKVFGNPAEHWAIVAMFILTIPLMVLGAMFKRNFGPTDQSEPVT